CPRTNRPWTQRRNQRTPRGTCCGARPRRPMNTQTVTRLCRQPSRATWTTRRASWNPDPPRRLASVGHPVGTRTASTWGTTSPQRIASRKCTKTCRASAQKSRGTPGRGARTLRRLRGQRKPIRPKWRLNNEPQ
ncbi:unnamed protein product, partial [Ixodes persulcatus]